MPATVALTGGTGFVGAAIARHLAAGGYRLRLLARRPGAVGDLGPDAEIVHGALEEEDSLARLVDGAEMVVHAAGAIKAIAAADFARVNRVGSAAIAAAARTAGARRLVLISSLAARSPLLSAYAASKRAGEREVALRFGPGAAILRPPVVYGPGDRETLPMFRAARHGVFLIPGPSEARLSFIHVADLASAVAACLAATVPPAGLFEIDDGKAGGYGWPEVASALGAAVGRRVRSVRIPPPLLRLSASAALTLARLTGRARMLCPDKANELRHPDWVCRDGRLGEATGWRATYGLEDGLRDAALWYRRHGMLT